MGGENRYLGSWVNTSSVVLMLITAGLVCAACDGGGDSSGPAGPFHLTFSLNESFQGPHGGQPIRMAVVRFNDWGVVAQTSGTISSTQNPSFSFDAGTVLEKGVAYAVQYWIDSNIGGGSPGVCDHKTIDHQWSTEFPNPTNDIAFIVSYNPALTEDVCDTFN